MEIGVDMHLYAGMSECKEPLITLHVAMYFTAYIMGFISLYIEMKQISHSFQFLPVLQVLLELMMATGVCLYLLFLDLEIHYTQLHM